MKQKIRLNRSNKRALVFMGEELYVGDTKNYDKDRENRWQVVRVFAIDSGYVLGVAELTDWIGERDNYATFTVKDTKQVIELIKERVPELEEGAREALEEIKETDAKKKEVAEKNDAAKK